MTTAAERLQSRMQPAAVSNKELLTFMKAGTVPEHQTTNQQEGSMPKIDDDDTEAFGSASSAGDSSSGDAGAPPAPKKVARAAAKAQKAQKEEEKRLAAEQAKAVRAKRAADARARRAAKTAASPKKPRTMKAAPVATPAPKPRHVNLIVTDETEAALEADAQLQGARASAKKAAADVQQVQEQLKAFQDLLAEQEKARKAAEKEAVMAQAAAVKAQAEAERQRQVAEQATDDLVKAEAEKANAEARIKSLQAARKKDAAKAAEKANAEAAAKVYEAEAALKLRNADAERAEAVVQAEAARVRLELAQAKVQAAMGRATPPVDSKVVKPVPAVQGGGATPPPAATTQLGAPQAVGGSVLIMGNNNQVNLPGAQSPQLTVGATPPAEPSPPSANRDEARMLPPPTNPPTDQLVLTRFTVNPQVVSGTVMCQAQADADVARRQTEEEARRVAATNVQNTPPANPAPPAQPSGGARPPPMPPDPQNPGSAMPPAGQPPVNNPPAAAAPPPANPPPPVEGQPPALPNQTPPPVPAQLTPAQQLPALNRVRLWLGKQARRFGAWISEYRRPLTILAILVALAIWLWPSGPALAPAHHSEGSSSPAPTAMASSSKPADDLLEFGEVKQSPILLTLDEEEGWRCKLCNESSCGKDWGDTRVTEALEKNPGQKEAWKRIAPEALAWLREMQKAGKLPPEMQGRELTEGDLMGSSALALGPAMIKPTTAEYALSLNKAVGGTSGIPTPYNPDKAKMIYVVLMRDLIDMVKQKKGITGSRIPAHVFAEATGYYRVGKNATREQLAGVVGYVNKELKCMGFQ